MKARFFWFGMAALSLWYLVDRSYPALWPNSPDGQPKLIDFTVFWAAAKQVLAGHPALVYEAKNFNAYEAGLLGQPANKAGGLIYPYPPTSFLFIWPLALTSYSSAWVGMQAVGLGAWTAALHRITRDWVLAIAMALAAGGATFSLEIGQNGLFTASLLVGALIALPDDKRLSGVLLGLLSFKPHLAAAAFVAFALWREWRALAWSVGTAAAMIVLSTTVFGPSIWLYFLHGNTAFVGYLNTRMDGMVRQLMQSVLAMFAPSYGIGIALAVQAAAAALAMFALTRIRGQDQRGAALIAATALVTPFSFLYDLTALVGAAALLLRNVRGQWEGGAILCAAALPGLALVMNGQIGTVSAFLLLGLAYYQAQMGAEGKAISLEPR